MVIRRDAMCSLDIDSIGSEAAVDALDDRERLLASQRQSL